MVGLLKGIALYGSIILGLNAIGNIGTDKEVYKPEDTSVVIEETIDTSMKIEEETKQEEINQLQQLYLDLNFDMTYDEIIATIKATNLPYRVKDYNHSKAIKIAFDKEVTPLEYAKWGENVQLHFTDIIKDNRYEVYTFDYIEYNGQECIVKRNENLEPKQLALNPPPVEEKNIDSLGSNDEINTLPTANDNDIIVYWTSGKSYHKDSNCHNYVQAKYHYSGTMEECPKFDPCDDCCY